MTTVFCVICISDTVTDVVHIFSTEEKRSAWADADDRGHIFYDYVMDCPERAEGLTQ